MKILVLNAGSSSLKFDLIECTPETIAGNSERTLAKGEAERVASMAEAFDSVFKQLGDCSVEAVGHRIVHGGDKFSQSVLVDETVEKEIEALNILAPLHNPHNLAGYQAAKKHLPDVPHVAVFDTAFHHSLPPHAYVYGLPYEYLTEKKIRRYGFHGISHRYVSWRFAQLQGRERSDYRMISCHLGNGCSVCAIEGGKSIDTSMGFTPLEGLIMGARSGDVDPGLILYLLREQRQSAEQVEDLLNRRSGLLGLSGTSADVRRLTETAAAGDSAADLALDVFAYRVRKYIGAYAAALGGLDAVAFTGGIGEHSAEVRRRICAGLEFLGIRLDPVANQGATVGLNPSRIGVMATEVWVVPTDEERQIARETRALLANVGQTANAVDRPG
jgi:acetate kinase